MRTLGHLLGSTARTDVLGVLHAETEPVGLRHVARVAGLYPRSVQLALADLVDEGLVVCDRARSRPLYRLNRGHPDTPVLEAVFDAAVRSGIRRRSVRVQERARAILPFIDQAVRLVTVAQESRGDT